MGTRGGCEEAVQLRLAGLARSQIADALGLAGGGQPLSRWLRILQSADVAEAVTFWSDVVGAPMTQFRRCTIKTHNPKTIRRNVGVGYHGCLLVYVRNSAELNLQIDGWCEGLAAAVQDQGAR